MTTLIFDNDKALGRNYLLPCLLAISIAHPEPSFAAKPPRPNIVLILADDLGWRDVSFHGGEIATPHIDRIPQEGVELERFYVCPVCSPTRAGLMTGRYPMRMGLMRTVVTPWRDYGLNVEEVTLANVLEKAGYTHRGVFGKWHLGHQRMKWHPLRRGFTHFHGHYNGALDYFTHKREQERDWHIDYEPSDEQGYTTDLIGAAAAKFIAQHAADEHPFFCYVPFNAPHSPLQAKPEDLANYAHLAKQHGPQRQQLAGMIAAMDDAVGEILGAIDDSGIARQTLVLFFSDNGGAGTGDNSPWRGNKGSVFEGGTRVAAAVRWPEVLAAGGKSSEPMMYIDVLPTVMRLTGVKDHGGKPLDGIDVWDALTGQASTRKREMFSSVGGGKHAVWSPPWKLVVENKQRKARGTYLFDLDQDPQETTDLAAAHPEVVARLSERIKWFTALEPEDHIPGWGSGSKGFLAPPNWDIRRWKTHRVN